MAKMTQLSQYGLKKIGVPGSDRLFPGEMHTPLYTGNARFAIANYMGPGTNLIGRLKRGDDGITDMDTISQAHDIRYALAKGPEDILTADRRMIKSAESSSDSGVNRKLGSTVMKAKHRIESKIGVQYPNKSQLDEPISESDENLLVSKLAELEQRGYGRDLKDPALVLKGKIRCLMLKNEKNKRMKQHGGSLDRISQTGTGMYDDNFYTNQHGGFGRSTRSNFTVGRSTRTNQKGGLFPLFILIGAAIAKVVTAAVAAVPVAVAAAATAAAKAGAIGAATAVGAAAANAVMKGKGLKLAGNGLRLAGAGLRLAGSGEAMHGMGVIESEIKRVVDSADINESDFSDAQKKKLQKAADIVSANPEHKEAIIEEITPMIKSVLTKKLKEQGQMTGNGLKLAGTGYKIRL